MRQENTKFFMECNLAGTKYHEFFEVMNDIKVGETLELEAEPDNQHDHNAVAVFYCKKNENENIYYKIGYIPRTQNEKIANILNMGWNIFTARIAKINLDDDNYENKVRLIIRIKRNTEEKTN